MRYLHTMIRVSNLDESLDFFCNKLGLLEHSRISNENGRFTLVYLHAPGDAKLANETHSPLIELTYNWDSEEYTGGRNFGHLAFEVENIYETCKKLMAEGILINRPPHDGHMAFIRSPDNISIELLQQGRPLAPEEPWHSMENTGSW